MGKSLRNPPQKLETALLPRSPVQTNSPPQLLFSLASHLPGDALAPAQVDTWRLYASPQNAWASPHASAVPAPTFRLVCRYFPAILHGSRDLWFWFAQSRPLACPEATGNSAMGSSRLLKLKYSTSASERLPESVCTTHRLYQPMKTVKNQKRRRSFLRH